MRLAQSATSIVTLLVLGAAALGGPLPAQAPGAARSHDPSERLREVLPPDVADRVLAKIADARAHDLPATALAQRALKFAARGVAPADIERAIGEQKVRMIHARAALAQARGGASGEEIEAGAEALREGVARDAVGALARSAPSGRSLVVPLYVLGTLASRGVPADAALATVEQRLAARATDADLEAFAGQQPLAGHGNRPTVTGQDLAGARAAGAAGGAGRQAGAALPSGVPVNAGVHGRPALPKPSAHP